MNRLINGSLEIRKTYVDPLVIIKMLGKSTGKLSSQHNGNMRLLM